MDQVQVGEGDYCPVESVPSDVAHHPPSQGFSDCGWTTRFPPTPEFVAD